jgi:hypothetical protein
MITQALDRANKPAIAPLVHCVPNSIQASTRTTQCHFFEQYGWTHFNVLM